MLRIFTGFYDSFYANPKLGVHIIDNLKGRLDNFYKGPKEIPPLDFNKTIAPKGSSVEIKVQLLSFFFQKLRFYSFLYTTLNNN